MVVKKAGTVLINKEFKLIGLVYRKKRKDLSFAKGHLEEGETLSECAIRETIEETGRDCHLVSDEPVSINHYITDSGEEVDNYMYLAIDDGKHIGESVDPEVCVWLDIEDVEDALVYEDLQEFWNEVYEQAKDIIKSD